LGAGLKPKDLCMVPARVAMALQADGWWLRSAMPWIKPNPMPDSTTDRPGRGMEWFFLLTKNQRYYYDHVAVLKDAVSDGGASFGPQTKIKVAGVDRLGPGHVDVDGVEVQSRKLDDSSGRNVAPGKRNFRDGDLFYSSLETSVRTGGLLSDGETGDPLALAVATQSFREGHFAVFPEKLIEPLIMAGTSEKGCCPTCGKAWERVIEKRYVKSPKHCEGSVVGRREKTGSNGFDGAGMPRVNAVHETTGWRQACECVAANPEPCVVGDPFGGAMTTAMVARRLGRRAVMVERKREYIEIGVRRLEGGNLFGAVRVHEGDQK
jgi:DNA modification methylase